MPSLILSSFFILTLFLGEISLASAIDVQLPPCNQSTDHGAGTAGPSSTLTVQVCSAYSYKADDGTTVVLGEVQNNNFFPITNVKVGVLFLDQNDNTLEYKTGTTLLLVVPPNGKAPFSISSTKADPSITKVSVEMAGFVSASSRDQVLAISPGVLQVSDKTTLSGTIKNNGNEISTNTRLYLLTYDAFQRVVAISTTTTQDIGAGNAANFNITSTSSYRARSYAIVAESDHYQAKITDVTNIVVSLPVTISNTAVTDVNGTKFSTIPVGEPVKISSNLNYIGGNSMQPYMYYVQVTQFGGQVAFIGKHQGVFLSGTDNPSVTWTPDTAGSYYIETYVWNSDNVPLSSAGTRINVVLVQP